jgi:hypothetical protein
MRICRTLKIFADFFFLIRKRPALLFAHPFFEFETKGFVGIKFCIDGEKRVADNRHQCQFPNFDKFFVQRKSGKRFFAAQNRRASFQ